MATKKANTENKANETPADPNKVHLCIVRDKDGIARAFGAGADKVTARKLADKAATKYETKNGVDLTNKVSVVVDLPKSN